MSKQQAARRTAVAGDAQPLDAFLKGQAIAAHRPPHIPALRMLPDAASQERTELPAFSARMPHLPAIAPIPETSPGQGEV